MPITTTDKVRPGAWVAVGGSVGLRPLSKRISRGRKRRSAAVRTLVIMILVGLLAADITHRRRDSEIQRIFANLMKSTKIIYHGEFRQVIDVELRWCRDV
ncbi:MAG: hypothetical protein V3T19_02035 [Acidiferrobacterales bacterium]